MTNTKEKTRRTAPPIDSTSEDRNFNFTPDNYFDLIRLFEEAQSLMPLGTKARANWLEQASAIKVPVPIDCPVCGHPFSFLIDPFDHAAGYCSVEARTYEIKEDFLGSTSPSTI